jgi:hypothetical protein
MDLPVIPPHYPHAFLVIAVFFIYEGITQNLPLLTFIGCLFLLLWGFVFGLFTLASYCKSHPFSNEGDILSTFSLAYCFVSFFIVVILIKKFFDINIFPK